MYAITNLQFMMTISLSQQYTNFLKIIACTLVVLGHYASNALINNALVCLGLIFYQKRHSWSQKESRAGLLKNC